MSGSNENSQHMGLTALNTASIKAKEAILAYALDMNFAFTRYTSFLIHPYLDQGYEIAYIPRGL